MGKPQLHTCTVEQPRATLQRVHMILHSIATTALLYYRFSHLFKRDVPVIAWGIITTAELVITGIWILSQAFRWRPVARTVNLQNLPVVDKDLPGVDVFICTADPEKEPVVEVMNTVLSAMALDYPQEKLSVYLSDDGGAPVTLYGIKEACSFARMWVPFCRKYNIKNRSPEAYFSSSSSDGGYLEWSDETKHEEEKIKAEYEMFKKNVEKVNKIDDSARHDRPPQVEVIHNNRNMELGGDQSKLPLLVYMSREKRPSRPHRFKAGALNALLRVSGVISNAAYILVLDCDMYCNDPLSAQQAMCFHLDANISKSLSYVQFPQMFYNVSKNDIYDGQARSAYMNKYQGMDGIRGSTCAGTGYYLNKKALYCHPNHEGDLFVEQEKIFGLSTKFNDSLKIFDVKNDHHCGETVISDAILEEAKSLATCSFEENTSWGINIGYSYESLLESTFTGYLLHNKGWRSVYIYPKRPAFLGCTTIDMKDAMVQLMKWASGLIQVGFSKFSPLTYGVSNMPVLQSMCYGYFVFAHLNAVGYSIYGVLPQLSFLLGVSLFPKVSDKWFLVFVSVYLSSTLQHLYEVVSSGSSILTWWNEQRVFYIKAVTGCLFGCLDALFKRLGVTKASFRLTNKAIDQEKLEKYEKGKFDFGGAKLFMIPLTLLVALNLVCFVGGLKGMVSKGNYGDMFLHFMLSFYIFVLSLPVLEGLVPKKKKVKAK